MCRQLLVWSQTTIVAVAPHRNKSCGRVVDKFGLRAWTINLRTWIFGFTCLIFKTTYIDRGKPLREGAFSFTRRTLFPPLNKRNTRGKAKGLCISSERHIGELGVRCLSTINRGQALPQPSHIDSHHPIREVYSLHTATKKVGTRRWVPTSL